MARSHALPIVSLLLIGCGDKGVSYLFSAPDTEILAVNGIALTAAQAGGSDLGNDQHLYIGISGQLLVLSGTVEDEPDTTDLTLLKVQWLVDHANGTQTEVCQGTVPTCADTEGTTEECKNYLGEVSCEWTAEADATAISLRVTDSDSDSPLATGATQDKLAEDTLHLSIAQNTAPTIEITSPVTGDKYYKGDSIEFTVQVDDAEDGPSGLSVVWSGADGLSAGESDGSGTYQINETLPPSPEDPYNLTATVTDSSGSTRTDTVSITVFDENTAPTCAFSAPVDGSGFAPGASIAFEGTCTDEETAPADLILTMSSHIDGTLSSDIDIDDDGNFTLPYADLSTGEHVISVTAKDTPGASSTDTITVTICDTVFYADGDGDGYGDADSSTTACGAPSGYVQSDADCDDSDAAINPAAAEVCDGADNDCDGDIDDDDSSITGQSTFYADTDGDGDGDADSTTEACAQPSGYVSNDDDCDDAVASCTDDCATDADSDGTADCADTCIDADADGYGDAGGAGDTCTDNDCDDGDAAINPAAAEVCDGADNDCDGTIDEDDADDASIWYADTDEDGYGNVDDRTSACEQPSGYTDNATDCDDGDSNAFPGNTEVCDEIDNDCDGDTDEGVEDTFYADADGDGFGDEGATIGACEVPSGYVTDTTDCDDDDAAVNPDAIEVCDDLDNDCDGTTDEDDADDAGTWYADADGDTYGDADSSTAACEAPSGYVQSDTDCDDSDAAINPGAAEITGDEVDSDCDGGEVCYADSDNDDYTDGTSTVTSADTDCADSGEASDGTPDGDCDDSDAAINPAAAEVCDGEDNDCDGDIDDDDSSITGQSTWYADDDGDTYGNAADTTLACEQPSGHVSNDDDCNDRSATTWPGAAYEDAVSDCMRDDDGDGYGDDSPPSGVTAGSDCDDDDSSINPDASEVCDAANTDEDCDGSSDNSDASVDITTQSTFYADDDTDGYGDPLSSTLACDEPSGYTDNDDDCDDSDAAISPAAAEVCDGADNDCDGDIDDDDSSITGQSTWYADDDGDTYGNAADTTLACEQPSGHVSNDDDCDDAVASCTDDCATDADSDGTADCADTCIDADADGYGDAGGAGDTCTDNDCDDGDAAINPAASEVCDDLDNDCDGDIDDGVLLTFYEDTDGDGYGDAASSVASCSQPSGYVSDSSDCDTADAAINPAAAEVCDGLDNDCDDDIDDDDSSITGQSTWYTDSDGDTYGTAASSTVSCDEPSGYTDNDDDCDDSDDAISPDAAEVCDGADNDCDGDIDDDDASISGQSTFYADDDGDGFGDAGSTALTCEQPSGYTSDAADCDDSNADINPDADEVCNDGLDNNCDDAPTPCGETDIALSSMSDVYFRPDDITDLAYMVDFMGDIDGDGADDVAVGAVYNDTGSTNEGKAYLIYGGVSGTVTLSTDAYAAFEGQAANDYTGSRAITGDFNGDDIIDVAVSGNHTDRSGSLVNNGAVGIYFGGHSGTNSLPYCDVQYYGAAVADQLGSQALFYPDWDNDNDDELIISAPGYDYSSNEGTIYLIEGHAPTSTVQYSTGSASSFLTQWYGDSSGDMLAGSSTVVSMVLAGDIDGDGIQDVLLGSDGAGPSSEGRAYLVLDPFSTATGQIGTLADLDVTGGSSTQNLGGTVGAAGDVNGDGYDDFLIGSYYTDEAWLHYGSSSSSGSLLDSDLDIHLTGPVGSEFGAALHSIGDLNGDSYADIMIGAYDDDTDNTDGGTTYVWYGPIDLDQDSTEAAFVLYGPTSVKSGIWLDSGDFNGDSVPDIAVGNLSTGGGSATTSAYIWFGESL